MLPLCPDSRILGYAKAMKRKRQNVDETIRELERRVAAGDESAIDRLAVARRRAGLSVARDRVERLLADEIGNPYQTTEGPVRDLELVARAVAWTLSAPVPAETFEGRPWAWEELSLGSVLVVRKRGGQVIIGIHAPDPASAWVVRYRQSIERDFRDQGPGVTETPEHRRSLRATLLASPPGHPGTSWPDLAYPAGVPGYRTHHAVRGDQLVEVNDPLFWIRERRHAYSWTDLTPAIARWADTPSHDRLVMSESEAHWFVREVFGFDLSSYEEAMKVLETGRIPRTVLALREEDLLRSVMPPVEQGMQPENAAGTGWADWAARRLVQILQVRRADRKNLVVLHGRAMDVGQTLPQHEEHRRDFLDRRSEDGVARSHVLVFFAGELGRTTARTRRSAWERVQDKAIEILVSFPMNMKPTPWGGDTVRPEGEFYITDGRGRWGSRYGGTNRDRPPYGLAGIAELVEKVILDFFPGADIKTHWHW